jgi:hypothetical protein
MTKLSLEQEWKIEKILQGSFGKSKRFDGEFDDGKCDPRSFDSLRLIL